MNPFMLNMMMNPMGFMGCGCGVSMPYYGSRDMFTFMNFPIFRNTASDFLLDPRLAMMQSQQSMMNGGSIFGNTFLPMFNNFPGMSPVWNPIARTETEEEKKQREAKEAEAKKPEAQKAASLKKTFDSIKKLAEKNKTLVNLDDSIIKKAEEAMKKGTAAEQLAAMKEVMALIPEDVIRKTILADDTVVAKLKDAGYNFNYKNNKYSLPATAVENIKMNQVHDNIVSKKNYDAQGLGSFGASAASGNPSILALISAWNNTQTDKGILRFIGKNLPKDEAPLSVLKNLIVPQIINALIDKADEYNGSSKIKADRDKLAAAKDDLFKNFNQANLNKVSDAFEALYARLRMQEAVQIRESVKANSDFNALNEVKEGILDDLIVAETYANLKEEGISNPPSEQNLDKIQTVSTVTVTEAGVVDRDEKYKDNKQGLIDEYLAKDNKFLTKIENTNVYQTKDIDGNGKGVRYFTVNNNQLKEVIRKEDGTFAVKPGTTEVKSKEIEEYDETILRMKNLIANKAIAPVSGTSNLYKATGADEYYALADNKFGKVKTSADSIKPEELTANDLADFDDNSVKSEDKVKKEKKEKEAKVKQDAIDKVVAKVSKDKISWNTINTQIKELGLENTGVAGYFKTTDKPTVYFRYDNNPNSKTYQKLVHLSNVTDIDKNGLMKKSNGKTESCREVKTASKNAEDLHDILNKTAYKYNDCEKRIGADKVKEDLSAIERAFNSFYTYNMIQDIIDFIRTYQEESSHWWRQDDMSLPAAIGNNTAIPEAKKKEYIKLIAFKINQIVSKYQIAFDNPDDKVTLEQIAKGKLTVYNYESTGLSVKTTACELARLMKLFLEKYDEYRAGQAK